MANDTTKQIGLSFPRETFAQLTPGPFLHAHLNQEPPVRPSGRTPEEFRKPTINADSLTHCHGSAVVRTGDTAVVCGVRGEILLASDIPNPPSSESSDETLVSRLGLLVPNVELSTGCSPAHLPGNPPGSLAQALSYRVASLLHTTNMIPIDMLRIEYTSPPSSDDDIDVDGSEGRQVVVKAYWALYIDILCIALDGNPFDAVWAAVVAALKATRLPKAYWDMDREMILCSPMATDAQQLQLDHLPIATTFAVYTTASPLKPIEHAQNWILADPDGLEEGVCKESLTVVLTSASAKSISKIEKSGGGTITSTAIEGCINLAIKHYKEWLAVLGQMTAA